MDILFKNQKLEKVFRDAKDLRRKLGAERTKTVLRRIRELRNAPTFGDYRKLKAGRPHKLAGAGYPDYSYGITITDCDRLVIWIEAVDEKATNGATYCYLKGVVNYHGKSSDTWYLL